MNKRFVIVVVFVAVVAGAVVSAVVMRKAGESPFTSAPETSVPSALPDGGVMETPTPVPGAGGGNIISPTPSVSSEPTPAPTTSSLPSPIPTAPLAVSSDAFSYNATIPVKYTCDGLDVHPSLSFSNVPANAESFAFIVDDPDAPGGTTTHWTVWNISGQTRAIAEGAIPAGAQQGVVYTGKAQYAGPCPPPGDPAHRYIFKLYALDASLPLSTGATRAALEAAMGGHVIAQAQLIGRYVSPAQ